MNGDEIEMRGKCAGASNLLASVQQRLKVAEKCFDELQRILMTNCGDVPCIKGEDNAAKDYQLGGSTNSR